MNSADSLRIPNPGFGLGLRAQHYADFLANRQPVDWLEVVSDNYLIEGGKPLHMLDQIRRDYPVVMHGVAMSLAAPEGVCPVYLKLLKALADRLQPLWVSDHLCWIGSAQAQLHDLNPIPYTEEAAKRVVESIQRAQDVLQRRLVVENVSSYVQFADSACTEWQFLSHVANAADCLLLLDVNNAYVSSVNHGFDPLAYIQGLPAHRIQQIHLAGHSQQDGYIIDTHDHPVAPAVWQLYASTCQLLGKVPTMIERDDYIPELGELLTELDQARRVQAAHAPERATDNPPVAATAPAGAAAAPGRSLTQVQEDWTQAILQPNPAVDAAGAADAGVAKHLAAGHRFGVYHNAYAARLADTLADVYERTALYMGQADFDALARDFARYNPPHARSLNAYGAELVVHLARTYPNNPELEQLAQLDWDLRHVFDAADEAPLALADVAADPSQAFLHRPQPLLTHLSSRPVTTNVAAIWNAIAADEEVPAPSALAQATDLIVWRKGFQPHFMCVDGTQAQLLRALGDGQSIAEACGACADAIADEPEGFLQNTLASWIEQEILRGPPDLGQLTSKLL